MGFDMTDRMTTLTNEEVLYAKTLIKPAGRLCTGS